MCFQSRFSHVFKNFNFGPKLSILQRLQPMYCDQFWPFSKSSDFSSIRCFFKPFFAHNNSNVLLESFLHDFQNFKFGPKLSILQRLQPMHCDQFFPFRKLVIFQIIGVFSGRFLHRTKLMCFQSHFSYVFQNFNFGPKLSILQRLQPMHCDQFWPFSKTCHFSNIRCCFKPFLCTEQI